ncbi:hypothetical protein EV182_004791, partial [Spiromyces aspiralis]
MEIRVVGNDAGEKLSILSGTLARLDRNAPHYGVGSYNDFNTFYYQAASGTSGGSSGSPVLDIYGDAIALNAGGRNKAASSFYLPLDRVVRAVGYIRQGLQVPRGTLQTEFLCQSYDELRRLNLSPEIERSMREKFPEKNGMLTVRSVLPEGPAHNILQTGDIVVAINDKPVVDFVGLFNVIDDSVGKQVRLTIWRNIKAYNVTCDVQDLHAITPSQFIEVAGGSFNELSYQCARHYKVPVKGVYVSRPGHMFRQAELRSEGVILSINNQPTPDLPSFIRSISSLTDGARVPVRFYFLNSMYREQVRIMNVACHWHSFRLATRNDKTGLWDYEHLSLPSPMGEIAPQTAKMPHISENLKPMNLLWPGFVSIDFTLPFVVDGIKCVQYYGPGLIVDKELGLVLCDRDTVPISLGDVYITIAKSIVIPGKIVYMHPVYNFAVLKYDPKLIGNTEVQNVQFHPDYWSGAKRLRQGDEVYLAGMGSENNPVLRKTRVGSRSLIHTREAQPPRWRVFNCEGFGLDDQPSLQGGVICDEEGLIKGLWVNVSSQNSRNKDIFFATGIDICLVRPVVNALLKGEMPVLRHLDLDMWFMGIAAARPLGLSNERVRQIESWLEDDPHVYFVRNILDPV